jgi:Arc/MetJ family transcription regulator
MYARYNIVTDDDLRAGAAKAAGDSVAMSHMSRHRNEKTREPSGAGV